MATTYHTINGYWKDNKTSFENLIVSNMDSQPDETEPYTDDDIFYYGLDEHSLTEAIKLVEDTVHDFVITSFTKIIQ